MCASTRRPVRSCGNSPRAVGGRTSGHCGGSVIWGSGFIDTAEHTEDLGLRISIGYLLKCSAEQRVQRRKSRWTQKPSRPSNRRPTTASLRPMRNTIVPDQPGAEPLLEAAELQRGGGSGCGDWTWHGCRRSVRPWSSGDRRGCLSRHDCPGPCGAHQGDIPSRRGHGATLCRSRVRHGDLQLRTGPFSDA